MSTICAEQRKLCASHQLISPKKNFKDLEISPRKLHTMKTHQENHNRGVSPCSEAVNIHKYLPCNDCNNNDDHKESATDNDDDDLDPYSSDHFRMYEFKVRRCTRTRSHDWTDCPFVHPGEKARRRDPRRYHYSGTACSEFRRGGCSRGDSCEFSHGVFECRLHPSRYRTEPCKDGKNCKQKVCFFAHSPRQLRILPKVPCETRKMDRALVSPFSSSPPVNPCHYCCLVSHSVASSPTSTLLGMPHLSAPLFPSLSPPLSQVKRRSLSGLSPISLYSDHLSNLGSGGVIRYKDALTELMSSLEAVNFNGTSASKVHVPANNTNVNMARLGSSLFTGEDQQRFILSPSAPSPSGSENVNSHGYCSIKGLVGDKTNITGNSGAAMASADPDLGWVNDLLM